MATSEARASLVFAAVPVAATGDAPGDAAVSPLGLLLVVLPPPQAAKLRAIAIAEIAVVSRFGLIKLRRKSIGIENLRSLYGCPAIAYRAKVKLRLKIFTFYLNLMLTKIKLTSLMSLTSVILSDG